MQIVFIFIGAMIILVGAVAILGRRAAQKRREAFEIVARKLNFAYHAEDDQQLRDELSHFPLFARGRHRKIRNLLRGQANNLDIAIFDYSYTTGSGNSRSTWRQTVALFETSMRELPSFSLRPEHMFHKIGQVFGYEDIDFDAYPDFSKKYLLRGENEREIRRLFNSGVIRFLQRKDGLSVEAAGGQLIVYRANKRIKPEVVDDFAKEGVEVYVQFGHGN